MFTHDLTIPVIGLQMLVLVAHDADVTVRCDGSPDQVQLTLRTDTEQSDVMELLTQTTSEGRLTLELPPLLAGHGMALQFGRTSITLGKGAHTTLELSVPSGTELDLDTKTGNVTVHGLTHGMTVRTTTGDVTAEACSVAKVTSGTGDVTIDDLLDGTITTASGDVDVTSLSGPLEATTASGDITLTITDAAPVTLRTGSGDITVGVAPSLPVWQEFTSATGDVDVRLSERGEPAEGQPYVRLTARTGTGDLSVTDA